MPRTGPGWRPTAPGRGSTPRARRWRSRWRRGRWLFALLKSAKGWQGEPGANFGYTVAVPQGFYASSVEAVAAIKALPKDQPVDLPPEAWPLMVTFDDIADPKTVRRVDPADLAATFGPGVSLKAVTLAVTDEPVTEGSVEGVLGWLETVGRDRASLMGKPPHGLVSDQPDPEIYMIAPSDFSRELYK